MDRRKEPRTPPSGAVDVEVLGEGQQMLRARILDTSPRGMGLSLSAPLATGTPIKVVAGDELILGVVSHCLPYEDTYRAGLQIKHRISGWAELQRLNSALQDQESVARDRHPSPIMEG